MNNTPESSPNPGDDALPGTPGTGEDICPTCHGSGKLGAARVRYTQLPSHRSEIVAILEW